MILKETPFDASAAAVLVRCSEMGISATAGLTENVQPGVDMKLLGHSQVRTEMDRNRHLLSVLARDAADRVGASCTQVRRDELQPRKRRLRVRRRRTCSQGWG